MKSILFIFSFFMLFNSHAQISLEEYEIVANKEVQLSVKLRGVQRANVSLTSLRMGVLDDKIEVVKNVKNGEEIKINVPATYIPGEFIIRYDYALNEKDSLYPSEQKIVIGAQDLILKVNPLYCNNSDSTFFQSNEIENTVLLNFLKKVEPMERNIEILKMVLLNYSNDNCGFFKKAKKEFDRQSLKLNKWIEEQTKIYENTYVKSYFMFKKVVSIDRNNENDFYFLNSLGELNLKDSLIIKTSNFADVLNEYVNNSIGSKLYETNDELELAYSEIAVQIIEKCRYSNPLVYGFVVDYFFKGFEANSFDKAMPTLFPYLKDPNCKTQERISIEKRQKGLEMLTIGTIAPNFSMGSNFDFHELKTEKKYKLLLFWSAGCGHCVDEIKLLFPLSVNDNAKFKVIAYSVDEEEVEVEQWSTLKKELTNWIHFRGDKGINSHGAELYSILSTPTMFLIDSLTNEIVFIPKSTNELEMFLLK